jgi:hypothetical protein
MVVKGHSYRIAVIIHRMAKRLQTGRKAKCG